MGSLLPPPPNSTDIDNTRILRGMKTKKNSRMKTKKEQTVAQTRVLTERKDVTLTYSTVGVWNKGSMGNVESRWRRDCR